MRSIRHASTEERSAVHPHNFTPDEAGAIAGEIAGAVIGSAAGPAGVVAGMVVGAVAGSLAGKALESEAERTQRHDEELDAEIGVTGGDLGAAKPGAPKANVGTPSAPSAGIFGESEVPPAEGPIQDIDV